MNLLSQSPLVPIFLTSLTSPLEASFDKTISHEPNASEILPFVLKELPKKMRMSLDGSSMTDVPVSYSVPPIDFPKLIYRFCQS